MNLLEAALVKQWGKERLDTIQTIKVGIAGAGGLGSNCAFNLVRSGFKKLVVVDFDVIDASNLNRQFYFADQVGMVKVEALKLNLLRINPELKLEIYQRRIEKSNLDEFFADCQVVVEAFDLPEYKQMLIEYWVGSGKFIVSASGIAGYGSSDQIISHHVQAGLTVVGDLYSEVEAGLPPVSPRVNIAAAKQADLILEWVLKEKCYD